jgi:hypothetical protein
MTREGPALHLPEPRTSSVAVGIVIDGPKPQIGFVSLCGEKKAV